MKPTYLEVRWDGNELVQIAKWKEDSGEYEVWKKLEGKMVWFSCKEDRAMQELNKPDTLMVMKDGVKL